MSYVRRVLQKDETVRYLTTYHWIIYVPGLALLGIGCAVWLASLSAAGMKELLIMVAMLLVVVAGLMLFSAWFQRWTTEIAVTNKRIIYKRGFIRRKTIEMHMDKVTSVDVDQSILGRMLGYGDIRIEGAGQSFEELKTIASPIEFRNHVTAE
jgi:uncharacterized membrane protein YdbT with pleckstrin-like domain